MTQNWLVSSALHGILWEILPFGELLGSIGGILSQNMYANMRSIGIGIYPQICI
jgi:hypothetical protein